MKKLLSGLVFIGILLVASCYKPDVPGSYNSLGNANAVGSNPTNPSTCTYAPYRLGSKMTQKDSNGAVRNYEVIKDTTIGTEKYFMFLNKSNNNFESYIGVDTAGNVWQYTPAVNLGGVSIPATKLIYLKPKEPVNATWSTTLSNGSTYEFKIVQKGISQTINGTNYTNGIKVNLKLSTTIAGSTITTSDADYLYFCGFGYYSLTQGGVEVSKVTSFTY
ncbi:MAG: hypothetical protein JNL75_04035 [Chitinophagales bacterium]|nr:hypothetical protein [Chitinophagales bacterium]